jgi:D-arabinose 1-dehydrogenase-like Zn-dependent alcohol dehydrogenase
LKAKFSRRIRATGALAGVAVFALACGGSSTTGNTTTAPKIGVVLTYNLPGFWANYLKYEGQYATQLNANLTTP